MEDMKKHREEELRELANKGWGALSWIKLSEPLEVSKDPDYGLVFEDALVFSFVKLVGKAFEDESRVLYGEAELC